MTSLINDKWLPFDEAHTIIIQECEKRGINSQKKWDEYCKSGLKHPQIPRTANVVYKNCGWVSFGHWLGNGNVQGGQQKYDLNHDFFKLWNKDMAYVLGFWFADGCICHSYGSGYRFRITQKSDDEYILKEIGALMGTHRPLYNCHEGYKELSINSKTIYQDIVHLGGKERKSIDVEFPLVPKDYLFDFIRGYFDGDGCAHKRGMSFTGGSYNFMSKLYNILDSVIPKFKARTITVPASYKMINGESHWFGETYVIYLEKNDSIKLRNKIYDNSTIYLKRKRDSLLKLGELSHEIKKREGVKYGF